MSDNTSYQTEALPKDENGDTYITDHMLQNDPQLASFLERTRSSWRRDDLRFRYVMNPTVGKS